MKNWILSAIIFVLIGCVNADTKKQYSNVDICAMLKLTINQSKLQQYFHIKERPDRKPLKLIVSDTTMTCTSLVKFGEPVKFIDKKGIKKSLSQYIEILKINLTETKAEISFIYSIEGVKGLTKLNKKNGIWGIDETHIVEM